MREIRNADGRLEAKLDEQTDTIIIRIKGCDTHIIRKPYGSYEVIHLKEAVYFSRWGTSQSTEKSSQRLQSIRRESPWHRCSLSISD